MQKSTTEKRKPWWHDMALHPDAPFIEFYATGRCQNPSDIVCPYCAHEHGDWYGSGREERSELECRACEKVFFVEASFGYGYSTYPESCKPTEHRYVFCAQYEHEGKQYRNFGCTRCGKSLYHTRPGDTLVLPWRDEYDDPAFFDPEGVLVSPTEYQPTPVLDELRRTWPGKQWNAVRMARALEQHDQLRTHTNTTGV